MDTVAIIIVNWNGWKDTLECLASIQALKTDSYVIRTIVIDNHSSDHSVARIRSTYPRLDIIENEKNLGFTGGNNRGIHIALNGNASYIWLLNNDTIVDQNALLPLVEACSKGSTAIAGSKIYFYRGYEYHKKRYKRSDIGHILWYAGGVIDWRNMYASHRGVDEVDCGQYDTSEETSFITGCSMMIASQVVSSIGLFDNSYYLYLEDVDFCLRAKRAGYQMVYIPSSNVWHKNAQSSDKPGSLLHQYYLTRNRLHIGLTYAPIRTKAALLREGARMLVFGTKTERQGVSDALMGRLGERYTWKKRK